MSIAFRHFRIFFVACLTTCLFSSNAFAQINLGTAADFCLFTCGGAIQNTGTSHFTGDIGSIDGPIGGFDPASTVTGSIITGGSTTTNCKSDLIAACAQLHALAPTTPAHIATFGNGETVIPGVHFITTAGTLSGAMTLDALGNSDAVFVFRINGSFTAEALSSINLINNAQGNNVYFIASGEIIVASQSSIAGTWIANDGAVSMAAGSILNGRLFSATGAVNINAATVIRPSLIVLSATSATNFGVNRKSGKTTLRWVPQSANKFPEYQIERAGTDQVFIKIAEVNSPNVLTDGFYQWIDQHPLSGTSSYRLKIIVPGEGTHITKAVIITTSIDAGFSIYPNPVKGGTVSIPFKGKPAGRYDIRIFNSVGTQILKREIIHNGIDKNQSFSLGALPNFTSGFLSITASGKPKQAFKILIK